MAIDRQRLGTAIRQVRQVRGISQAALAKEAGLQGNSVALIERGQRGVSMDTLNALADALDVPAACLAMLGTSKIGENAQSAALVKSLQKLILATIVAQARTQAEEVAEKEKQSQIDAAMRSIPELESVVRRIAGKGKPATRTKKVLK